MLEKVIGYCREAGIEILRFYGSESQVSYKEDKSPLTAADRASHDLLVRALEGQTPTIAVVSEESASETTIEPGQADNYWLVDPLDGTKEFLKQSGDFTVNVALIQGGQPVLGVVYVPAKEVAYFAERGSGAWRQTDNAKAVQIRTRPHSRETTRIVASKDHAGPEVEALLRRVPDAVVTSIGSSLKFCLIAEGEADFYPRFVPTMEWDTAAAHCVVENAGGSVQTLDGNMLRYGKPMWKNPSIVTVGDPAFRWRELIR
jgi:3'(2'), 5'-bisphosphate nucleotidase